MSRPEHTRVSPCSELTRMLLPVHPGGTGRVPGEVDGGFGDEMKKSSKSMYDKSWICGGNRPRPRFCKSARSRAAARRSSNSTLAYRSVVVVNEAKKMMGWMNEIGWAVSSDRYIIKSPCRQLKVEFVPRVSVDLRVQVRRNRPARRGNVVCG